MQNQRRFSSSLKGYIRATHFGPTLRVVFVAYLLSLSQYFYLASIEISLAIFAGQCAIGWSNDLIDHPLDLEANRIKKPLVAGDINPKTLKRAIFIALSLALFLSLIGPLGVTGTLLHAIGLLSALAYNFKLKKTRFSVLPYVISFGAMPWAIFISNGKIPPLWLYLGFVVFAVSFHFLNVIKDLDADISQGVLGLPQLLGRTRSIAVAAFLFICGVVIIMLKWSTILQ